MYSTPVWNALSTTFQIIVHLTLFAAMQNKFAWLCIKDNLPSIYARYCYVNVHIYITWKNLLHFSQNIIAVVPVERYACVPELLGGIKNIVQKRIIQEDSIHEYLIVPEVC
jgi:hypothetical protein